MLYITLVVYAIAALLLIIYRKKFHIQDKIFLITKTKFGLKTMKKLGSSRWVKVYSNIGVVATLIAMGYGMWWLFDYLIRVLTQPGTPAGATLVIPGVTIPLIEGIIAIVILAIVHEGSHGAVAESEGVKVKSSGFGFLAFLPILPLAFVEMDEKSLNRVGKLSRIRILSAGSWANLLTAGAFMLLFVLFGIASQGAYGTHIISEGVQVLEITGYPLNATDITINESIISIDNVTIHNMSAFVKFMQNVEPNQTLNIRTNKGEYTLTLKDGKLNGVFGPVVYKEDLIGSLVSFIGRLLKWIVLLNIAVGIVNAMPVLWITDGCRILHDLLSYITNDKIKIVLTHIIISLTTTSLLYIMIVPRIMGGT